MKSNIASNAQRAIEKIWLKSYPKEVPPEVDIQAFTSLAELLEKSFTRYRERPAFSNMGSVVDYGELDIKTRDFAAFLQQELCLKRGSRVAIMMPNLLQYPIATFGVLRAGLTVTNINPLYTPRELKHQLVDSGASTIILLENFCHVLAEVLADTSIRTVITTRLGDLLTFPKSALVNFVVKHVKRLVQTYDLPYSIDFMHALNLGARHTLQPIEITRDDIAFLQYTAGTTGVAKGVLLSHGNIVANLQQALAWIKPYTEEGKEVIITPLPLYHIFSLTANCLSYMKIGGLVCLITNPRDLKGFIRELKKHGLPPLLVSTLYTMHY